MFLLRGKICGREIDSGLAKNSKEALEHNTMLHCFNMSQRLPTEGEKNALFYKI